MTIGFKSIGSLTAERNLGKATAALGSSFERLSSGQRINKASDDAAGLAVSASLNVGARVFAQGMRNVNDGISFLNVGEAALNQLKTITIRQKELATQSANGVYSSTQRDALQKESLALTEEYNRIVNSTQFNGLSVLDTASSIGDLRIQAGYGVNNGLSFSVGTELARNVGTGSFQQGASFALGTGYFSTSGDINGDGYDDIIISTTGGTYGLMGDAKGSFNQIAVIDFYGLSSALVLSDVNNDGKLDLVRGGGGGGRLEYSLGNGNGGFSAANPVFNSASAVVGADDLNGDGLPDIVTGNFIYWNSNTSKPFATSTAIPAGFSNPQIVDIDGDGKREIVAGNGVNAAIYRYAADGSYSTQTIANASGHNFGDVNRDGKADELFFIGSGVYAKYGAGDGTFGATTTMMFLSYSNYSPLNLIYTDLNNDGITDFLDRNTGKSQVSQKNGSYLETVIGYYLKGTGDFNGDGVQDIVSGDYDVLIDLGKTIKQSSVLSSNISNSQNARICLKSLDDQLARIETQLGSIGIAQSRLSTTLSNLSAAKEQYSASASRITDVDIAEESANLVRNKILQDVASQVLTSVNQQPRIILKLLEEST